MDVTAFLRELQNDRGVGDPIVAIRELSARPASFADPADPLPDALASSLATGGVTRLYRHQARAVDTVARGGHPVIVTGTASGKTLCYNVPVLEALLRHPDATAIYLFPTKALAQDQLGSLAALAECDMTLSSLVRPATYDGDTPAHQRRRVRQSANIILTNPDMLHQGILPYHGRWSTFLSRLRFVVLDEIHAYRGIFGSHVACVLRRLRRIAAHYDAAPRFICCSATIANPQEHAERLTGLPMTLIDDDGSPRGRKHFVLWNPPRARPDSPARRSGNVDAKELMSRLVRRGAQTITFCKARVVAELIYRYLREELAADAPQLADRVRPYRGGYLANERREIERLLFSGQLLGVCSTNALELGIDVGTLDAAIIVGFPGTVCSMWQQAGRAGRTQDESLVILVAYDDPVDQYLIRDPDYFFGRPHELALVDPQNEVVRKAQLQCAASELTLARENAAYFGETTVDDCRRLAAADAGWWHDATTNRFRYHASGGAVAATRVSLRHMSDTAFAIVDETGGTPNVIGQVDAISAPELLYPEAVYLHEGDSYLVNDLDPGAKVARVRRCEVDYYTQPILADACTVVDTLESRDHRGGKKHFGIVDVTWQTIAFKKIKYYTMEVIGQTALNLPPQTIRTQATWVQPPVDVLDAVRRAGHAPTEGLVGIRNTMLAVLPLLAMCDRQDLSGVMDSAHHSPPAMFVYDRFPGGVGYARAAFDRLENLLAMCRLLVSECPCESGCPSCVGLANLRPPLHQDPDLSRGYAIPDKRAALLVLDRWLGADHPGARV